jgi:hypothetical protein
LQCACLICPDSFCKVRFCKRIVGRKQDGRLSAPFSIRPKKLLITWRSVRAHSRVTEALRPNRVFLFALERMTQAIDFSSAPGVDRAALARQVQALVEWLHPAVTLERRRDDRLAIPVLFRLTPLDDVRRPIEAESITVVGKNISRRGVSFYHERPLSYRRALLSAQHPEFDDFAAEIDITWCRFTKPGWYESGGRLLAAAPSQPSRQIALVNSRKG